MDAKAILELHRERLISEPGGALVYAEMAKASSGGSVSVYDATTIALRCASAIAESRHASALARLRADLLDAED